MRRTRIPILVLVIALAGVASGCRRPAGEGTPTNTRASAKPSVEAVSPKGDVSAPVAFEWKTTGVSQAVYRLNVYDTSERQLLEQDVRSTRFEPPPDVQQQLVASTRRFLWKVAVVDGNGDAIAETPLTPFTVK